MYALEFRVQVSQYTLPKRNNNFIIRKKYLYICKIASIRFYFSFFSLITKNRYLFLIYKCLFRISFNKFKSK